MSDDLIEKLRWSAASTEVSEELTAYGKLLDAAATEIERLRAARNAVLEEAAKLLDLRMQDILLIAGEMTAQEIRSVRAMLNERARAIRALKENTCAMI